jgi:ADP-dependent glucokinase
MKQLLIVIIALIAIAVSIIKLRYQQQDNDDRKSELYHTKHDLIQLSQQAIQQQMNNKLSVAIGYNSNVDLIVKAIPILNQLSTIVDESVSCDLLYSKDQFVSCFRKYFRNGNGVERFVTNGTFFNELITLSAQHPSHHYHIGGNAALMAVRFALENWKVSLTGGSIGNTLKNLLSSYNIRFITKSETEPDQDDEIHLIMEYDKAEFFANFSSPRANRFIVTRDISNAEFYSLDNFHKHLDEEISSLDLVVLSGFHLLDGETDSAKRQSILKQISEKIRNTLVVSEQKKKKHFVIHLELASIGQEVIYNEIAETIFPYVHSLGLNEQELYALYHSTQQSDIPSIAQLIPDISSVTGAINTIMKQYSHLHRIHFHNLAYHLLAVRDTDITNEDAYIAAVTSSSLQACTQACGFTSPHTIDLAAVDLLFKWNEKQVASDNLFKSIVSHGQQSNHSVISWTTSDNGYRFYLSPVLVCKQTIKTVGLGDAISTLGLSAQLKVFLSKEHVVDVNV